MVSRRAFLRGGSLAGLASLVPAAGAAVDPRSSLRRQPLEALCDTRHPDGDAFLTAVAPVAFRAHGVGADPAAVFGVVADATAAGRLLLGLTTPATLMITRQVAAPHGYALVFQGEHAYRRDGQLHHRLRGDSVWLNDLAKLLQASGDAWPQSLGRTLAGLPADRDCANLPTVDCTTRHGGDLSAQRVSWVLAPVGA
jgi:hypothetical protein